MRFLNIISILLILTGRPCLAEENNYFLELGLHSGGDRIPTEEMAPQHRARIRAGSAISASLVRLLRLNQSFSIAPSIGIKHIFTQNIFISDRTEWTAAMLNLPILYRINDWQFGAGFTYHYKPTLSASNESDGYKEWEFDDSIGTIMKLVYYYNNEDYYNSEDSIGLQYMEIDYTRAGVTTVKGDNVALIWRIKIF